MKVDYKTILTEVMKYMPSTVATFLYATGAINPNIQIFINTEEMLDSTYMRFEVLEAVEVWSGGVTWTCRYITNVSRDSLLPSSDRKHVSPKRFMRTHFYKPEGQHQRLMKTCW
jgi:hypothetical protein